MTPSTKPVTRITHAFVRDRGLRQVIVTIHGETLLFRLKGTRRVETLDVNGAFNYALRSRIALERSMKAKARAPKKGGK